MKTLIAFLFAASAFAQTAQYPGALATDANLKVAVNGVNTLLTATITSATLTTSVSSCAGIVANVLVTIDQEIMPVSGCSGTVISFNSRGYDGTTAAAHNSGAAVGAFVDAWHHNSLRVEVEAIESSLGVSLGNVVLSSAIINPAHGGTGVNNSGSTITLGGNLTLSGAYNATFVIPSSSSWTLPAAGTLIGSASTGAVTNALLAGSITASKLVGTDIATVGTVTAGTWNGTAISPTYGGTGVNNGSNTLTLAGNVTFSGAYNTTFLPAATGTYSLPAAGTSTLIGSADSGTVTNGMLAGSIAASKVTGTAVTQADTGTVTNAMLAGSITNAKLSAPVTVTACGTVAACSATTKTTGQMVLGTVAFSSATSATITGMPAFTSASSYACYANNPTHTYTVVITPVSSTSFTITAGTSNSDTWQYWCGGY